MRGVALRDHGLVDVAPLLQHAREEVPQLASDINGVQVPNYGPGHDSFDTGELTQEDKAARPCKKAKELVEQPQFMNPKEIDDTFDPGIALGKALAYATY